jgi:hypothetical protein
MEHTGNVRRGDYDTVGGGGGWRSTAKITGFFPYSIPFVFNALGLINLGEFFFSHYVNLLIEENEMGIKIPIS